MAIYKHTAKYIVRVQTFNKWWNSYNCELLAL